MKSIKLGFVIALTAIFSQVSIAQAPENPQELRAKNNTESLNQKIIAKNKDVPLTDEQRVKIIAINLEQVKEIDEIRAQYPDNEVERKAKNQAVYGKQYPKTMSVLTDEQKLALKKE